MTDYQRLHGSNVNPDIDEALEARTKDALWFLARQWQMGEFEAEPGGSPMRVEVSAAIHRVDRIRLGETMLPEAGPAPLNRPLEALVEAEEDKAPPLAWVPEALEYRFGLRAGDWRLEAGDYDGRGLDWHDFDLDRAGSGGEDVDFVAIPSQLEIAGAPDARWWAIEDGAADFELGGDAEPNVLSLMLPEFVYTDLKNWYLLPVPMPSGALRRVSRVAMVDSFGIVTEIDAVGADEDEARAWALYELSGEGSDASLFFAPDIAVEIGRNDLVEEVRFLRDEAANLVWAWERQLTGEDGVLFSTDAGRGEGGEEVKAPIPADHAGLPRFRLASEPGRAWVPFVPRQQAATPALDGQIALRRARSHGRYSMENPQYRGRILAETSHLAEEEVPPTGIAVKRQNRFARSADGGLHFWVGRSKDVASQSPRPDMRFDYLDEE